MNHRADFSQDQEGRRTLGLASVFGLLAITLGALIAGYWFWVLEPRLTQHAQSSATALAQAQSISLAKVLSREWNESLARDLETEMDVILLIRDPVTKMPFVLGLAVAANNAKVPAAGHDLDRVRGNAHCGDCFHTEIPLYDEGTRALVGIATFHSNPHFLQSMIADVREKMLWGGLAAMLLIGFAWSGANRLLRRLRQSEANLRNVFEAAPFPIMLQRSDKATLGHANRSAIAYLDLELAADGGFDSSAWQALRTGGLLKGDGTPRESVMARSQGTPGWMLVSSIDVRFSGVPSHLISLADITPLKRIQRELERARQVAESATVAKSEFLATMSHEIRTPLNAILGIIHLLAKAELPSRHQEEIATVLTAGDALLSLVNDILDFSHIESGRLQLKREPFNLGEVLDKTLAIFVARTSQKGLVLESDIPKDIRRCYIGDTNRLRQILINLLGNAVKFTDSGLIRLQARVIGHIPDGDQVQFRVTDTGIGVPAESLARLFDEFVQMDGSTSRQYSGTGLGLAICRRLVKGLSGEIGAESTPGEGSSFWFSVPLVYGQERHIPPDQERISLDQVPPMRLLVVDDEPLNRRVLTGLLEGAGHSVREASNGLQALEVLAVEAFDLVLLDLRMPVMNGFDTARHIRGLADANRAITPIVALTADVTTKTAEKCRRAGMNEIATKPLLPSDLARLLLKYRE